MSVTAFQDLPLADRDREWDSVAADKRVRKWADAEDKPDPLQLKKAVLAFANHEASLACVQAKLGFYNTRQNLLTRWFAIEYALWFNLTLPGLQWARHSTSRFTMVGAANIEVRGHASNSRSTSSASNELDSGVTLMPSRATVAIM